MRHSMPNQRRSRPTPRWVGREVCWFVVSGLMCGGVFCCFAQNTVVPPPAYEDAEAYTIYNTLIEQDWTVRSAHAKRLLIVGSTVKPHLLECQQPEGESVAILAPLLRKLGELGNTSYTLLPKLTLDRPYDLVARDKIDGALRGGWEEVGRAYPLSAHSYIEISPVAFNADKTIAVVYEAHHCGSLCGGGNLNVLQKQDGVWRPMRWTGKICSMAL